MSITLVEAPPVPAGLDSRTPIVRAQDRLDALVDIVVQARKIEAMQHSVRVGVIHEAIEFVLRNCEAFTSPKLSPARRRELARRSVVAELATALRTPEQTMARLVDEASSLCTQLPATFSALAHGAIDYAHARVIVDATNDLGDDDATRARIDVELAARARDTTAAALRRVARRLREDVLAESLAERHARARAERRVEFEPAADGMAWLHLFLEASDAMLICDRLAQVAADASADASPARSSDGGRRALRSPDSGSPEPGSSDSGSSDSRSPDPGSPDFGSDSRSPDSHSPERRTPAQLRADVARDLLLEGVPAVGEAFHVAAATVRPSVHVTVPVLTLLSSGDEPGELDGYGPIAPDTARRLAAHAPSFTRLLTHPVDGVVLDLDRTVYRPPADLAKWLRVRDETCRFPGCNRRASRCDLDHTDDFAEGGRTAFDNLAHLCAHHHHLKHESSWSVKHRRDGVLEWRSPAGKSYETRPAAHLSATRPTRLAKPATRPQQRQQQPQAQAQVRPQPQPQAQAQVRPQPQPQAQAQVRPQPQPPGALPAFPHDRLGTSERVPNDPPF